MASKTTLNAKNLESLGAARLAQLLIEISTGNAAAKRKLRLELVAEKSPRDAAREIAKRLTTIANGKSAISWKKRKAFVDDLQTQRRGIVDRVAPHDPAEALLLMWRFMGLTNPVILRCQGSDEDVFEVFCEACGDIGKLAMAANQKTELLVDSVFEALCLNSYGQFDKLLPDVASVLGVPGLAELRRRFEEIVKSIESRAQPKGQNNKQSTADFIKGHADRRTLRDAKRALRQIADAQGDVDAFIAQVELHLRRIPENAIYIARRLLAAGRAAEALKFLDAAHLEEDDWDRTPWQDTRLEVLEAMGKTKDAQAFRWECFERDLSADYLRAYIQKLPDFDDIEAEERAIAIAMADPEPMAALQFFIDLRSPARASEFVIKRHKEVGGDRYDYLTPAADVLAASYPLAATLLLRAMIDFALSKARSKRYRHVAAHLATCAELAPRVEDFGQFESHESYLAKLKEQHGRKKDFWSYVK